MGLTQYSFVPGRHITDNIVIAQEIIHLMKRNKGSKGWIAIKVDIKKPIIDFDGISLWIL